jgi:hypothetical protein
MRAHGRDAASTAPDSRCRPEVGVQSDVAGSMGPTHLGDRDLRQHLETELVQATAELEAHMASWEYAFAMAGGCHGGRDHPVHWATAARTEKLAARCRDLRARLAEYQD